MAISIIGEDRVYKNLIIYELKEQLPDADEQDIGSFVKLLLNDAEALTFRSVLLNVFVNMPLSLTVKDKNDCI